MTRLILFILLLPLTSCGNQNPSAEIENQSSTTDSLESKITQVSLTNLDMALKVFDIGNESHLTDTCAFLFECDCCSGELFFNTDSTFIQLELCMSDYTLLTGNFRIGEFLELNYDVNVVMKDYNYENEIDTSAVDYFFNDTILYIPTAIFNMRKCNDKILLSELKSGETGLESKMTDRKMIQFLLNEGFKIKTIHNK